MVTHTTPSIGLRAVRPADALLLPAFFESLSDRSLHQRFSSPLRRLTPAMIEQLTAPDPRREVCLVAVDRAGRGHGALLGMAQLYGLSGAPRAEGGLVVADSQQRLGLGSALIDGLIRLARARGVGVIWGLVQPDNHAMLGLAHHRGHRVVYGELGWEVHVPVPG